MVVLAIAGLAALWASKRTIEPEIVSYKVAENADKQANDAEQLVVGGDITAAVKHLEMLTKRAETPFEKRVYISRKATLLYNDGQKQAALDTVKQALKVLPTAGDAAFAGQIAYDSGDRKAAGKFYSQALDLLDTKAPMYEKDKQYYEAVLNDIKAGKKYGE